MTARTPAWRAAVQAAIDAAPQPSDATLARLAELLTAPGPVQRRPEAVRP